LLDVSRQLENAHLDGQHIVRVEPEIDVHDSSKACQEQSRADEKHDGERDLCDHEQRSKNGRAFWTGDITPLQELSAKPLDEPVHRFDIDPRASCGSSTQGMNCHLFGDKYLEVPNEPQALVSNYYLKADALSCPIRPNSAR
jgi:hypothetical protein